MSHYAPFDEMVPSSYFLTTITSTKSRGAMIPIAAEGVTVLQIEMSCARMGDKGMNSTIQSNKGEQKWLSPLVSHVCISSCTSQAFFFLGHVHTGTFPLFFFFSGSKKSVHTGVRSINSYVQMGRNTGWKWCNTYATPTWGAVNRHGQSHRTPEEERVHAHKILHLLLLSMQGCNSATRHCCRYRPKHAVFFWSRDSDEAATSSFQK